MFGSGSSQLRNVVALYACSILGVLEDQSAVGEKLVSVLVPSLARAVKSKCHDFKAAGYMVLGQLVTQSRLQQKPLEALVYIMVKVLYSTAGLVSQKILVVSSFVQRASGVELMGKCGFCYSYM